MEDKYVTIFNKKPKDVQHKQVLTDIIIDIDHGVKYPHGRMAIGGWKGVGKM